MHFDRYSLAGHVIAMVLNFSNSENRETMQEEHSSGNSCWRWIPLVAFLGCCSCSGLAGVFLFDNQYLLTVTRHLHVKWIDYIQIGYEIALTLLLGYGLDRFWLVARFRKRQTFGLPVLFKAMATAAIVVALCRLEAVEYAHQRAADDQFYGRGGICISHKYYSGLFGRSLVLSVPLFLGITCSIYGLLRFEWRFTK